MVYRKIWKCFKKFKKIINVWKEEYEKNIIIFFNFNKF